MPDDKPKLPKGAADWVPPTEDEIAAAAEVTPDVLEDAAEWARGLGGELAGLLDATPYEGD